MTDVAVTAYIVCITAALLCLHCMEANVTRFVMCLLSDLCSRFPDTDCRVGWYDGEVWDLGHSRAGALPQPCSYVLPRCSGRHRRVRHH